ncbi:MAG: GNAT family N-acetyltransferase [Melioribacteraceae bacterium]|nr:GNAT family N-acetyltransferase [Melioribacteraceae bacterium]
MIREQPTLPSERLILRPFTVEDAVDVKRLAGDRKISDTTLMIPHPYSDGLAEEWIKSNKVLFSDMVEIIFAVTEKLSGELIGSIGLRVNKDFNNADVGYWIGVPYWSKGYATEALHEIIKYGFEQLKLHRIHAHHMISNPASGKVMLKNGMKMEVRLREHIKKNGEFADAVYYGILKEEFQK